MPAIRAAQSLQTRCFPAEASSPLLSARACAHGFHSIFPSLRRLRHLHRPVSPKDETPAPARADSYIKPAARRSVLPKPRGTERASERGDPFLVHRTPPAPRAEVGGLRSEVLLAWATTTRRRARRLRSPRGRKAEEADKHEAGGHPSGMGVAGDSAAGGKRGTGRSCELCGGAAAVHCAADSAFLCMRCDAKVHGANFLASRHLRRRLPRRDAAEPGPSASASSASSTSCVSTADSAESAAAAAPSRVAAPATGRAPAARRPRPRAEAVLEGWAKRMGFAAGPARRRAAAAASALRALGRGVAAARVPLRVAMAAALWSEVAPAAAAAGCRGNGGEAALLCRLEAAAHVPARLVLTVASWVARAASRPAGPVADADADGQDHEEGWAECSGIP